MHLHYKTGLKLIDNKKYRAEIDGLRAIAVIAVVIFHLNPIYLPGGFIGVDIFFVISGYLITNIIATEMIGGHFTFKRFYERRIKRILPIFYLVLFTVFVVGYFILSPSEYKSMSNSAFAANGFLANFRFMLAGSYFQEENMRPLLHLWSLAVEEQFYFIWPTLLIIIIKLSKYRIKQILTLTIILSFIAAEIASRDVRLASMSYYMLPTRVGELLLGGILVFIQSPFKSFSRELFSATGAFLILGSLLFVTSSTVFPGIYSFIPCLGCAMIIASGSHTQVAKFLSLRPMIFFGLISYSLYLWHWPIIVFYKSYFLLDSLPHLTALVSFGSMVLLSWFTTEFIENKFRKLKIAFRATVVIYLLIPMLIIFIISGYISKQNGLPTRFDLSEKMTVTSTVECMPIQDENCYLTKGQKSILVLGDSHAKHFSNFYKILGDKLELTVIRAAAAGCAFDRDEFVSENCESMKSKITNLAQSVDKVVIIKRIENVYQNEADFNQYISFIKKMTRYNKQVMVMAQVPKNFNERFIDQFIKTQSSNNSTSINDETDLKVINANTALKLRLSTIQNVGVVDFTSIFCDDTECRLFDDNQTPLYFDDDHISAFGAEWLARETLNNKEYQWFIDWLGN
jgi:peptidoglycan/LPS O-acetylase OafA/YrhL